MKRSNLTNREFELLTIANSFATEMVGTIEAIAEFGSDGLDKEACDLLVHKWQDTLAQPALFVGELFPVEIVDDSAATVALVDDDQSPADTSIDVCSSVIEGIWAAIRKGRWLLAWKIARGGCELAWLFIRRRVLTAIPDTVVFHDLRHTSASILFKMGTHPKIVQAQLGHSKISLTMDTYSHLMAGMQNEAAAHMDTVLRSKIG